MKKLFVIVLFIVSCLGVWGQDAFEEFSKRHSEIGELTVNSILIARAHFGGDDNKLKALLFDVQVYLEKQNQRNLLETIAVAIDAGEQPIAFMIKHILANTPDVFEGRDYAESFIFGCHTIVSLCFNNASLATILPDAIATFANRELEPVLEIMKR